MPWHKIAELQQIPQGSRKHVELAGHEYMLIHTRDGHLHCVDHRCPHADGAVGDGMVLGTTITCPLHKWRFDLCDGSHVHKGTRNLGVYQVKVEGRDVLIETLA
jgi:nitrite reductase (NADH) small subunit